MRFLVAVLLALSGLANFSPAAEQPDENDPVFKELLAVRQGLIDAYNARDVDALVSFCHPDVVVTWQNAEVSRGREGIKTYYQKMMVGDERVVDELRANPTVDERALLFGGDTAISRGQMNDHYRLRDGSEFDLDSRWSATLVKEDDRWQIAAFHASTNAFDNDILRVVAKRSAMLAGGVAVLPGALLGAGGCWLLTRRRKAV
jgi:ketosteroid isomerase-like protein